MSSKIELNFKSLEESLSADAVVVLPSDPEWAAATLRWQARASSTPNYLAVVHVATEQDIQTTVKFANQHSLPFLAISGGHGLPNTLSKLQRGIGISLKRMKTLKVLGDGSMAELGPGLKIGEIIRQLDAVGKRAATGSTECVGNSGLMLGGGFGFLQGRYGLPADNIVEANVVLADGSAVTASATSHPDLFWALRGAGHNFGIVTSYKYKIYDKPNSDRWSYQGLVFTQDKLEEVFKVLGSYTNFGEKLQPVELIYFAVWIRAPDLDKVSPIIHVAMLWEGPPEDAEPYFKPLRDLGPIHAQIEETVYANAPKLFGADEEGQLSQPGALLHSHAILLDKYNIPTMRKGFDYFAEYTGKHPELAKSMVGFEGYSYQGVRKIPAESTAVPNRHLDIIMANNTMASVDSAEASKLADFHGRRIQQIMFEGSGMDRMVGYVNYANGEEPVNQIYGEDWRVEKLRALKKLYDPFGKFNFYNGIV